MKLSKEKKQHWILTIIVMVAIIYGVWFYGIDKQAQKERSDTNEKDNLAQEIADTDKAILREKNNREQAKVFQNYIAMAESKMPKGNTETWLVTELSNIATRHKITLLNTVLQPVKSLSDFKFSGQPYQLEGFHLDLKGEFNQIGSFIQDMENSMPMVEVNEVSITSGSEIAPYVHSVSMSICIVRKT
jgi:Tfp pilus assembly protein PilO